MWLATVLFPDGTRKYGTYSTVVECLLSHLFAEMVPEGGTLPDGSTCHRAQVIGDHEPEWPDAERAPLDKLVPVVISVEPDQDTWHALYCPRRAAVLGPMSSYHVYALQRRFELVPDGDGVRHLRQAVIDATAAGPPDAACGRSVPGEPQPFHTPWRSDGGIGYVDVPGSDLYADWTRGDVCRVCLASQLPEVEEDPPPAPPRSPLASRSRSWIASLVRW